ncbi:uncharacterized protein LOC117791098 isoform X2 [Drosophila innubila]|uniref:uncharacterized protein LOC117791098 isoform X2 n=1 Tax=Drosophila innubila TaxID=198719 RepID=UPI00148BC4F5|nr:uncharacterized protein LOC117791098 isoform X2 [Drosophila innubila]
MKMIQQLLLYLLAINIRSIFASCSVTRIIMRVPREHDIGLLFDLKVFNRKTEKSQVLDFSVSAEEICTLNTTNGEQVLAGNIFGGDFGSIEPGSSITVSLVWPTVSLYNRVGSCPIVVSSVNHLNEVNKTKQILYFDTRFETLDPGNHSLRRRKDFNDCKNWDKNYFRNCTPLNCEELYFGKRSYYNRTTEQCEPAPACIGDGIQYDFYANECVDTNNFITDDEIEQLKQGKFDNNYMELHEYRTSQTNEQKQAKLNKKSVPNTKNESTKEQPRECNIGTKLSLVDFNNCFQHLNDPKVEEHTKAQEHHLTDNNKVRKKSTITSILKSFYYDWYLPLKAEREIESESENESTEANTTITKERPSSGSGSKWSRLGGLHLVEWISLILEMLLIVS